MPSPNPSSGQRAPANGPDLLQVGENKAASWAFKKYAAGMIVNWKTSLAGVAAICTGIAALINYLIAASQSGHLDMEQLWKMIGIISAGVGLLHARDGDKTSEQQPREDGTIPKALPVGPDEQ